MRGDQGEDLSATGNRYPVAAVFRAEAVEVADEGGLQGEEGSLGVVMTEKKGKEVTQGISSMVKNQF